MYKLLSYHIFSYLACLTYLDKNSQTKPYRDRYGNCKIDENCSPKLKRENLDVCGNEIYSLNVF